MGQYTNLQKANLYYKVLIVRTMSMIGVEYVIELREYEALLHENRFIPYQLQASTGVVT